ncbi:MAG TPA: hemerythrin domain-containing protein [Vicinamibacteria bacterium]|nr:hemerythrin domain-containing protein [Vicinamibacteria bacterium]
MREHPSITRAARALVSEHGTLRQLLSRVVAAFGGPTSLGAAGPDVVSARLDTLRGPLAAHFDEEERAGLFEQIEEQAPEHSASCIRLRRQHQRLLQRLDLLRRATPLERRGPSWTREVRSLVDDIYGHEACETDLLTRALDGGTAAGD